jgi:uncharacterized protein YjbI with pentapeptide repeats
VPYTHARMPSGTPQVPNLPDLELDLFSAGSRYALDAEVDLERLTFDQLQAGELDLPGARLDQVSLSGIHVAAMAAGRTDWHEVEISGRIGSLDGLDARWRTVHFTGCKLDYVNLRGAELLDLTFTDCTIGELDLLQANLRRVRFVSTEIDTLGVRQARLRDVDLRGATMHHIDGLLELGGATISEEQASGMAQHFARELGIRVEG